MTAVTRAKRARSLAKAFEAELGGAPSGTGLSSPRGLFYVRADISVGVTGDVAAESKRVTCRNRCGWLRNHHEQRRYSSDKAHHYAVDARDANSPLLRLKATLPMPVRSLKCLC